MLEITLSDGKTIKYSNPITISKIIQSIDLKLFKKSLVAKISIKGKSDKIVDMNYLVKQNMSINILTVEDKESLNIIYNSAALLLANAVKNLFPNAKLATGPVINDGFYYDFFYPSSFSVNDLSLIEKEMIKLARDDKKIELIEWNRENIISYFQNIGENYKVELASEISTNEKLNMYRQGNFIDFCRGPLVPATGKLKFFKLMKVAGAYWRGNSKNEVLQRIYGIAWSTKECQKKHLKMLDEANRRDHRKIGRELDLFHFQEENPGFVYWHPNGWIIWKQIEKYMHDIYLKNGYQEVKSPQILDLSLWKKTGHWENYSENMFIIQSENRLLGLKPMNCPGHVQIFNSNLRSYRDLPLRYAELGQCHRNESSGSLHGMMRVRGFTQDDGHIFCTEDQLLHECFTFTRLVQKVYKDFGFEKILYRIATRPEKRIGDDKLWDQAEDALKQSLVNSNCEFEISKGDGAFYGPKIEYTLTDAIGRQWQCGTIQVDFSIPARLEAEYVDYNGQKRNPVMLHRAILGSFERFIAILIENYHGFLPIWLSPIQVIVCCISDKSSDYAAKITKMLKQKNFRAESDLRGEKIARKIRDHTMRKIPYIIVVGDNERKDQTVSVRGIKNSNIETMSIELFFDRLKTDIDIFPNIS
ncbi:MAG: threonine--tRNA ligase [Bordetella sp.]|nr:MAG: threonine--tRNA ligase [Bordetella sp.]